MQTLRGRGGGSHRWKWNQLASEVRAGSEQAQGIGLKQIWAGKELMLKFRTRTGPGSDTFCHQWDQGRLEERDWALQGSKGSDWIRTEGLHL